MSEFVCSWCGVYCRVERVWRDDGELLNRLSDEPALLRVRDAELLDGGLDRRLGFRCLNPADILPLGAHRSARMARLPARTIRGTPARRGRPSTPTVYGGEVVFRAGGGGLQTIRSGAAQTAATAPNGQGKGPSVFFNSEDQ